MITQGKEKWNRLLRLALWKVNQDQCVVITSMKLGFFVFFLFGVKWLIFELHLESGIVVLFNSNMFFLCKMVVFHRRFSSSFQQVPLHINQHLLFDPKNTTTGLKVVRRSSKRLSSLLQGNTLLSVIKIGGTNDGSICIIGLKCRRWSSLYCVDCII